MTKKKFHGSRKRKEFKAQGERDNERKRADHPFTVAIAATPLERLKSGANSTLANGGSSARRDLRPRQRYEITPFQAFVLARSHSLTALSAASPSFS